MPIKEQIETRINDTGRQKIVYPGEAPLDSNMTALRLYTTTTAPTVNNDSFDSAGLGRTFEVGDFWQDTTTSTLYRCIDSSQAAASWGVFSPACSTLITICASGGQYATIQAALDANTAGGEVFLVYPGTYTDDTINFSANNQSIVGIGTTIRQTVTNSTTICDAGAYTSVSIENMTLTLTATTAANIITGSGSMRSRYCRFNANYSGTIADNTTAISYSGTYTKEQGRIIISNTATSTAKIKSAVTAGTGASITLNEVELTATGSGASGAFVTGYSIGTGEFTINRCDITLTDAESSLVVGLANVTGSGDEEFFYNTIHVTCGGASKAAYGVFATSSTTLAVRSGYNHIHALDAGGGGAYGFSVGANVTITSQFDDIIAEDGNSVTGTLVNCSSIDDGGFTLSNYMELPYLSGAPATLRNGMIWMEADGLHIYYNSAEKTIAGS